MKYTEKRMGFVKSDKPFEKRIALLPIDIIKIKNKDKLYFEEGYGSDFGIDDSEYTSLGCHIEKRNKILRLEIICDPKIGEAKYLHTLKSNTIIFGWIHAVEHPQLVNLLCNRQLTCYAWEDMYKENNHVFWRNNEIAGEGAVLHALQCFGVMAYDLNAAIIGRGNTAMGAHRVLTSLGAKVKMYHRATEALLIKEIAQYDVVVNAVLWDHHRDDYILSKHTMNNMKIGSMIIDVSDDDDGAIQDCHFTTIDQPTYILNDILVYAVNNVPSLFYKTASREISNIAADYIDDLITSKDNKVLNGSCIIKEGIVHDIKIVKANYFIS